MSSDWFFAKGKEKIGPVSYAVLQQLATSGHLAVGDMVLREGASQWQSAECIEGLFAGCSVGIRSSSSAETKIGVGQELDGQSNSGPGMRSFVGHIDTVKQVLFHPSGKVLFSTGEDKTIRAWRVEDGQETWRFDVDARTCIAISPNGHQLVSDAMIWQWDGQTATQGTSIRWPWYCTAGASAIAFSPNDRHFAMACKDRFIRLWDSRSGRVELAFGTRWFSGRHARTIGSLAFTPNGRFLLSGSEDGTVRQWGMSRPDLFASSAYGRWIPGWWTCVYSTVVAIRPTEELAAGFTDGYIRVWPNVGGISPDYPEPLSWHATGQSTDSSRSIRCLEFSRDGRLLASGTDTEVCIWEFDTRTPLLNFKREIFSGGLSFSPDGKLLAFGDEKKVRVIDIPG